MSEQDSTPEPVRRDRAGAGRGRSRGNAEGAAPQATPPAVPVASDHPDRWGRVDDDGTVYVEDRRRRARGRVVAGGRAATRASRTSRAGSTTCATEVELLEARLTSGAGDPKHAMPSAQRAARSSSPRPPWSATSTRWPPAWSTCWRAAEAGWRRPRQAERGRARDAVARKEALVDEAEQIAHESTQWKVAGDRLRDDPRRVEDRSGASTARPTTRCGSGSPRPATPSTAAAARTSPSSTAQRGRRKAAKEELVDEAEELVDSDRLGRHRRSLQGADGRVEGRRARAQGGRRRAVAAVPGRAGRVLRARAPRPSRARRRVRGERDS